MRRSLTAILIADTVGYSRMMGLDEAATLTALVNLRESIFEPTVSQFDGEIVKSTGDGWLVKFASAVDAVQCAVQVQDRLSQKEGIQLRIGVHLGDVMHDDDGDVFGAGVNIAARLEGVSPVGGVAISDQVHCTLDHAKKAPFVDGGAQNLKNISHSVRVWTWDMDGGRGRTSRGGDAPSLPTILLDPMTLGGDEKLAADVAMEILSGLEHAIAKRSGIRVVTGTDVTTYRLHGRCYAAGNRCRVHLSITAGDTGDTRWSTKVDGDPADLFGFVDDVVWQVGAAIRVQLNAQAGAEFAEMPDEDLTDQQLLSKAAFHMHRFDAGSMASAQSTMAAAVQRTPEDPMALAMYAYTLMQSVPLAMTRVEEIDAEHVLSVADKSVELGPNVDYAHHNRARIRLWLQRDHAGCVQDANRALMINPGFHFAKEDLALADIFGGDLKVGVESLLGIVTSLPDHPTAPYRLSILSLGYTLLGDTQSALTHAREGYERKSSIRLHPLAYAAAAADNQDITGSAVFEKMVAQHQLRVADATRFPFADDALVDQLARRLRAAGLPD